eukprot:TRINITY_DN31_c0_g1_i4.p1 TRINITY_DN31_c0_g1~~TRINITY_DN31_c0_g1_i4.p1  ORF type:complete len:209 (+),score=25.59 TRINITY_DN31_c0_g1_i4:164-790(+)
MLRSLVGSEMCIRDRVSTQSTGASEFDMDNKQTDGASEATIPARSCELVSRGSETTSFNVLTPFGVYEGAVEDGVWTKGPPDLFCPQCRICKTTCRIIACGDSELGIKPCCCPWGYTCCDACCCTACVDFGATAAAVNGDPGRVRFCQNCYWVSTVLGVFVAVQSGGRIMCNPLICCPLGKVRHELRKKYNLPTCATRFGVPAALSSR